MTKYEIKHGSYYLVTDSGEIVTMTDQVAIAYTEGNDIWTMYKHGRPEFIEKYFKTSAPQFDSVGLGPLKMIKLPRGFPVDEINKVLDITGYIQFLVRDILGGKYDQIGSEFDLRA